MPRTTWLARLCALCRNLTAPARREAADLARNQDGAAAIMIAISMTALIGFIALGVEVSYYYLTKRNMQNAADAAAFAAAYKLHNGGADADAVREGQAMAAEYGYSNSQVNVAIDAGHTEATVEISSTQQGLFAAALGHSSLTLNVDARGGTSKAALYCVLTLGTSGIGIDFQGNANFSMPNCGFQANSSAANAVNVTGNSANITAAYASAVGGAGGNHPELLPSSFRPHSSSASDPYASVTVPSPGACAGTAASVSGTLNLAANTTYCSGLTLSGNLTINGNNHALIITDGNFDLGNRDLTVNNATIVMTNGSGGSIGTLTRNGNSTVRMDPPNSGATSGIVWLQKSHNGSAATPADTAWTGNFVLAWDGVIYAPNAAVSLQGGGSGGSPCASGQNLCAWQTSCNQLVAKSVSFAGGVGMNNQCGGVPGAQSIGALPKLKE